MTFRIKALSTTALFLAAVASAQADPTAVSSVFATGGPVGGTQPDSITVGGGSVWVEYGNTADSTGAGGSSTIVEYSLSGAIRHSYSIAGEVDGLKVDPATGIVWALQNQDANSTISFINPTTNTVSGPLKYGPPYQYTTPGPLGRGYDDIAFLNGKVYLSYTNPVNPTDPVLQILNNGNHPSGTLTTTNILTAAQTNPLFTNSSQNPPDIDSLKSTPNGDLVLTSEGDGLGPDWATSDGRYTLIGHPGTPQQTVTNVRVTNQAGVNVNGMDDVIFPDATSGWLFVAGTPGNVVDKVYVTGLTIGTPIIALGSFNEVATVNPTTGVVETPLLNIDSPHGMDFLAAPEPSTWAMMLLGFAGLGFMGYRASAKGRVAQSA
jgi:PEP-CTERM motif